MNVTPAERGFTKLRNEMVRVHIEGRGIRDSNVLRAMRSVPRHRFVSAEIQDRAYVDGPLPIGCGQTISQPYIVALMTELARLQRTSRVLDVGTGCGYQAAVLAEICERVESVEIVETLALSAADRLARLGYDHVHVRHANARAVVQNHEQYDAILVAAAPDVVPTGLVQLLAPGGRMVIPVGTVRQTLKVISRTAAGDIVEENICPVSFVPMTGQDEQENS